MAVLGYLYIAVVLVLVAGIEASPVRETESPKESFLRRYLIIHVYDYLTVYCTLCECCVHARVLL